MNYLMHLTIMDGNIMGRAILSPGGHRTHWRNTNNTLSNNYTFILNFKIIEKKNLRCLVSQYNNISLDGNFVNGR